MDKTHAHIELVWLWDERRHTRKWKRRFSLLLHRQPGSEGLRLPPRLSDLGVTKHLLPAFRQAGREAVKGGGAAVKQPEVGYDSERKGDTGFRGNAERHDLEENM